MTQLKLTEAEFNVLPLGREVNVTAIASNREWIIGCTRGTETSFLNWGNDWTFDGELVRNSDLAFLDETQTELRCGCGGYDYCGCGGGIIEVPILRDKFGRLL